jgi:arylsulfatase A-like enzyme
VRFSSIVSEVSAMFVRKSLVFLLVVLVPAVANAANPTASPTTRPTTAPSAEWPSWAGGRPVPAIKHAIIISIDGCRPDVLLRANTPSVRRLMETGCYSFWAQTIPASITLPSHTSMLTGVSAERHGVMWNSDLPDGVVIYPQFPTIFEVAKSRGLTTAMATGKTKFDTLDRPGSIDWDDILGTPKAVAPDTEVGDSAVRILRQHRPDLMFVHFPGADSAGHSIGWGSKEQVAAIERIDRQIGRIMDALDDLNLRRSTVVLVSADHGGQGRGHGPDDPRSRHIPWIIAGPGLRQNYDLNTNAKLYIRTEDTFATISFLLGLPISPEVEGQPVKDILPSRELLVNVPTTKPASTAVASPTK